MNWRIQNDSAWFKVGEQTYRHYCGAVVKKHDNLWVAISILGVPLRTSGSASAAVKRLEATNDHRYFWRFRQWAEGEWVSGRRKFGEFEHVTRPVYSGEEQEYFAFCASQCTAVPNFLRSSLSRSFFSAAVCVACERPMTALRMRDTKWFDALCPSPNSSYLACACGYPVWRMDTKAYGRASYLLAANARNWRRAQLLRGAGGNHGSKELEEILNIQKGLCLYCNKDLTTVCKPSKDHLLAVTEGGSDFASNIVVACRNCNSRRGNIPFRTYCRLLSPAQNRRILQNLGQRFLKMDWKTMPTEEFRCLIRGLVLHDPRHRRYLQIQDMSREARRNISTNRLLAANPGTILKRLSIRLKRA